MTGALPPELEVDTLERGRRRRGDLHAGPHRTGHRHHGGRVVHHQRPARVAVAADDVEDARREVLGHDLGHERFERFLRVATRFFALAMAVSCEVCRRQANLGASQLY